LLPALKKNEKIFFIFLTNFICILFIAGIFFSYNYVLPLIINFLTSKEFFPENVGNLLNFSGLIMFIIKIILGFGLAFQMPVIVLFLLKTRIFTKRKMFKFSKIIIVVVFIIAAVLTPPDWVSQVMLALPMIIILLWFNDCIYF
jgi:sec-independent protein translocase protein TatC